jgi:hypothetical protein
MQAETDKSKTPGVVMVVVLLVLFVLLYRRVLSHGLGF